MESEDDVLDYNIPFSLSVETFGEVKGLFANFFFA
jgi:hypothetical protein